MKNIFFTALLLALTCTVSAETLSGSVINQRGEAMPFVTVSVLTLDSTLLTGAITDDEGKYEIDLSPFTFQL